MAAYLNQNYYGNESYGVAAAAKGYFGVELKDLTLAQAAILAALPQAPSALRPRRRTPSSECVDPAAEDRDLHEDTQLVVPADARIVQRRNCVLDQMAAGRHAADRRRRSPPRTSRRRRPRRWSSRPRLDPVEGAPVRVAGPRASSPPRLCGADAETCPVLERGGLDIVEHARPRAPGDRREVGQGGGDRPPREEPEGGGARPSASPTSRGCGTCANKTLRNGALIAMDYQTGEIVAY